MSHSIDSPDNTLAIAWVSDLNPSSFRNPESPSTLSPSSHTSDPSPSKTSRGKRKRSNSGNEEKQEITPSKIPRLTRQALRTIPGNSSMGKNPSPQKTPTTRKGVSSTEPDHVKSKATVHDTRLALASIGLHYDRPGIKDKYPAFFEVVENHLKVERASAMAAKSAKKCIEYSYENATTNEKSYHEGMKPLVLKDSYTGTSNKRDFAGELKRQEMSFADDDNLISRPDMLFPTCTLPYAGKGLGLTIPKPDWLYGMKQNMYQWPQDRVPDHVRPYISFGADLDHPFFAIENKGCEGTFEDCENQCMRTGAALVHARRHLNRLADTTATTGLASPPASTSIATGPDHDSFYFTCAWATGMARIFVHWFEDMGPEEEGLMHTTRLKSYLADSEDHLKEFRMVGHNIYDWGIHVNQKASKAAVAKIVERAKKERAGRT